MFRKFISLFGVLALSACSTGSGLLVSNEARAIGGNLFIEKSVDGGHFLVLDGEITPRTLFAFQSILKSADPGALIIAQSPGGDLLAAHEIGRAVKARNMDTVVLATCVSACVDVFIAGQAREMTEIAELGLHAATNPEIAYEIDVRYWTALGFAKVNEQAYKVPNGELWIVPARRAKELRLATSIMTLED